MNDWSEHFPDDALGKFCSRDSLQKILSTGSLLWSRPSRFNDPFDCQPHFRLAGSIDDLKLALSQEFSRILRNDVSTFSINNPLAQMTCMLADSVNSGKISYEEAQQIFMEDAQELNQMGPKFLSNYRKDVVLTLNKSKILCLSKAFDEMLMWSHYANNHAGALIVFAPTAQDSQFSIAKPVRYCEELPELLDVQTHALLLTGQISMVDRNYLARAYDQVTLTKASSWSYEREFRIAGGDGFNPEEETELNRFSLDDVVAVVFGVKFSTTEISKVIQIMASIYPKAKLFRSNLSSTRFGLELEPIQNT